ncbi:MAG: hypothetical protein HQL84_15335 [Magnetococcales bacterium]|nr:hypothetical protein [Magnetococcales bacterium]MBF0151393.1 hypothetical protein [Magnetococcales bacterium]MBF0174359.1 hypothetical protein [Magnetococcales bacterium]
MKARNSLTALVFGLEQPGSTPSFPETGREITEWFHNLPEGPPLKELFRE